MIFCLKNTKDKTACEWGKSLLMASGMSSSRLIKDLNDIEDKNASRRVEFRVRTKADENLSLILKTSRKFKYPSNQIIEKIEDGLQLQK
ncbi:MAG: hypothetical protein KKE44_04550 [Proteobacteria bacterium]|nr:hypothetical protein [Pseudomonadota bacterium]MBU1582001.1 hypothetical protein [Pseudomonadota bacterium]MBU2628385.1 hypothetical protein [Pseudomonadota bacterium]